MSPMPRTFKNYLSFLADAPGRSSRAFARFHASQVPGIDPEADDSSHETADNAVRTRRRPVGRGAPQEDPPSLAYLYATHTSPHTGRRVGLGEAEQVASRRFSVEASVAVGGVMGAKSKLKSHLASEDPTADHHIEYVGRSPKPADDAHKVIRNFGRSASGSYHHFDVTPRGLTESAVEASVRRASSGGQDVEVKFADGAGAKVTPEFAKKVLAGVGLLSGDARAKLLAKIEAGLPGMMIAAQLADTHARKKDR